MIENNKEIWILPVLVICLMFRPVPVMGNSPALVEYALQKKETTTYTIQRGDTLWSVGHKFGIKPTLLAMANNMQPEDLLLESEELVIPLGQRLTYSIEPGDTLWDLARKYSTSVALLAEDNNIEIDDSLQVGQSLVVNLGEKEEEEDLTVMAEMSSENSEEGNDVPRLEVWPVNGIVSSGFGFRNGRMHEGIDVAADSGKEIRAVANGVVVFAGDRGTYGNTVIINHGRGFRSLYAHASSINVSAGDTVREGETIARIGSTGRSTGPHLHLEILYNGTPLNPMHYLP